MSFVKRFIILCPYLGGSTIGGFTVIVYFHLYKIPCTCTSIIKTAINWPIDGYHIRLYKETTYMYELNRVLYWQVTLCKETTPPL